MAGGTAPPSFKGGKMLGGIIGGALGAINGGIGLGLQAKQNRITREREDNAVQRRARDMELAGINPLLSAGDPAQTSNMQAPKAEELGGALQQAGQFTDQIAIAKKMQILQEQSNKQYCPF